MYIMLNCIHGYAPGYFFRLYLSSPSVFAGFFRKICSGALSRFKHSALTHRSPCPDENTSANDNRKTTTRLTNAHLAVCIKLKTFIPQQHNSLGNHRQREPLGENRRMVRFHFQRSNCLPFVIVLSQTTGFFKTVTQ